MGWKKFNSRRKVRKKSIFLRKWFLIICACGFLFLLAGVLVAWFWSAKYRERAETYDLSKINEIEQPNMIIDRDNLEIGRIFTENRDPISVEEVPSILIDTLLAAEDARFYSHNGYDLKGISRVVLQMATNKGKSKSGGASTLTQQLARNAFHLQDEADKRGESTIQRKMVEIFLARRIEEKYTKTDIMGYYLNRVNFGGGFHGIRSASLGYFGKEPKDLELHECASLVGAIRNPSIYSPSRWTGKGEDRVQGKDNLAVRNRVLSRMAIEGKITAEEREKYQAMPLGLNPKPIQRGTSQFHDRVAEQFQSILKDKGISEADIAAGGFKIFTTLDGDIQRSLKRKLNQQLDKIEARSDYEHDRYSEYVPKKDTKPKYLQGAGIMIDHKTGEVLAYVGGRDFEHSQYDFIKSGTKPLGTAFFPFIYTSALENGMDSAQRLIDEAMDNRRVMIDGREGILGEWGYEVLNPKYEGDISMRRALAASKIAATVRLGRMIGLENVWKTASKFGMTKPKGKLLNRSLLGSESAGLSRVTRAYGAFANQGKVVKKLVWITRIEDAKGNEVYKWKGEAKQKQVIDPSSSFLVHTMLNDALKSGSGSDIYKDANMHSFNGGGKTGTTSDFSNHWFVGYNGRVSCGIWAGFFDGPRQEIYPEAFSKNTVMPVWLDAMKTAQRKLSPEPIPQPEDIVKVHICNHSGLQQTKACEELVHDIVTGHKHYKSTCYTEYFHKDKRPRGHCPVHGIGLVDHEFENEKSGQLSASDRLNIIPIKPKAPTLLGDDPYQSNQPVFAPMDRNVRKAGRGLNSMDFEILENENAEATIILPEPKPLQITE